MIILVSIFAVLAAIFMFFAVKEGKKSNIVSMKRLIKLSATMVGVSVFAVIATVIALAAPEAGDVITNGFTDKSFAFLAAALSTGTAAVASGYAVAASASAAIGAISENEKISGKALIYVVMGEGIALYGVIISVMILNKI